MINKLIKLATYLDSKGLYKEASYVDRLIFKKSATPLGSVKDIVKKIEALEAVNEKLKDEYDALELSEDLDEWEEALEEADLACQDGDDEACDEADLIEEELEAGQIIERKKFPAVAGEPHPPPGAVLTSSGFGSNEHGERVGWCYYRGSDGNNFIVHTSGDNVHDGCGPPIPDGEIIYDYEDPNIIGVYRR